ncbi:hypothetical protein CH260_14770 [Rhodococcus sp. 05-2256-B2]|nr:hypothetical protein CH258_06220 [Rhodococcus sp. 05-2256-B4]OZD90077.1 hypothetical protein CH257_15960 [Rhodococcus sp. 05-2256-B3]OZD95441.1 hypothetical protein CH260_14770 [Rhodococcus sp. 05-2256-B2]OZE00082.1 hypothetical protein CH285_17210 [Rhodococcus sp. 05-2256-B1]
MLSYVALCKDVLQMYSSECSSHHSSQARQWPGEQSSRGGELARMPLRSTPNEGTMVVTRIHRKI